MPLVEKIPALYRLLGVFKSKLIGGVTAKELGVFKSIGVPTASEPVKSYISSIRSTEID
jgi:hypothetical protein